MIKVRRVDGVPQMCVNFILWFPHVREAISTTTENACNVDGNHSAFLFLVPILPLKFYFKGYIPP